MTADDDTIELDPIVEPVPRSKWAWLTPDRPPRRGRRAAWGGFAGMMLAFAGIFGAGAGIGLLAGAPALPSLDATHLQATGPKAAAMTRSTPTRIRIPAIRVSAPMMAVGLATDGTIGTPPLADANLAAWYSGGPAPGENGPAIVVGHVDGPKGESVFYNLGRVKPGDKIELQLADGKVALFTAYSVESYPKGKFPGDRIFGDYSRPGLRLITCGGKFVGGSTGYADNVVVYATLTSRG